MKIEASKPEYFGASSVNERGPEAISVGINRSIKPARAESKSIEIMIAPVNRILSVC